MQSLLQELACPTDPALQACFRFHMKQNRTVEIEILYQEKYTLKPALVSALYKLSYGASRCNQETIKELNTNRAFFATDINNAQHDIDDFSQVDFDGDGKISDEELKRLANSDIKISKTKGIMELLSTHPDSLKRVKRLAELEN